VTARRRKIVPPKGASSTGTGSSQPSDDTTPADHLGGTGASGTQRRIKKRSKKRAQPSQSKPVSSIEFVADEEVQPTSYRHVEHSEAPSPTQEWVAFNQGLFEQAREMWIAGDWGALRRISEPVLEHHPERARLALIVASAHAQENDMAAARRFVARAREWGCDRRLMSRVLISGVYNSLGRAAAMMGGASDRALRHFECALATAMPGRNVRPLVQGRSVRQLSHLELRGPNKTSELPSAPPAISSSSAVAGAETNRAEVFSEDALRYYETLAAKTTYDTVPPFLLLDSKSLPRSGLHYLRNTLAQVLGGNFSFCEWYQEPGCCKRMPCALKAFASGAQQTGELRLRLTKSHDFALNDPAYPTNRCVRRIILVRHPLYMLTSYFALDQLDKHKDRLQADGINMRKIWLHHEPDVVSAAYQVVNDHFTPLKPEALLAWLRAKTDYAIGFFDKWARPANREEQSYVHVVRYEQINKFIIELLGALRETLSLNAQQRADAFCRDAELRFKPRASPFAMPVPRLTDYVTYHAKLFESAAIEILSNASCGYEAGLPE
jgi:hypothetical protein